MDLKKVQMHFKGESATVTLQPSNERGRFTGRQLGKMVAGSEVSMDVPRALAEALQAGETEVLANHFKRSMDDGSVCAELTTPVLLGDPSRFGLQRLDDNTFTEVEPVVHPLGVSQELVKPQYEFSDLFDARTVVE